MPDPFLARRRAGVLVPLFSIPTSESWGIGEVGDLPALARWVRECGMSAVQLLPINEMAEGQSSPYSALSAMAIDPIFISLRHIPEFADLEDALTREEREQIEALRATPIVEHRSVRELKTAVLRRVFEAFQTDWSTGGVRAGALQAYVERERWWLPDYALFRALHAEHDGRYWIEWPEGERTRDPGALEEARRRLEREVLYYTWLQWIAGEQWAAARRAAEIEVLGDFPFMVSGDSADVWTRQHEFRLDASVGVPPDAFSETGQDWGLPVYRWDALAANDFEWLRQRARRCADLFDGFRVDHLVGFYRTFVREKDGATCFVPPDEPEQREQGERLMRIFQESGASIIAEDLGTVPDFVRESLARLEVPGMKVLRWERDWETERQPFRDPADYPQVSVAISGTHDTETVAEWWDNAEPPEREEAVKLPAFRAAGITAMEPFGERVRDVVLDALFSSGSVLVLLPVQDVFGWRDRINTPALVDDRNWSWRLPWPSDCLLSERVARERAKYLRGLTEVYRRR